MYALARYNPLWPRAFEHIAAYLRRYVPGYCIIHHIGSTSVAGMPAKDIIDITIEYTRAGLPAIKRAMRRAGYRHLGDLGLSGRDAFAPSARRYASSLAPHHVYACQRGAYELLKHLALREYLRHHRQHALWLARKKQHAAIRASNKEAYINKSNNYAQITEESLRWLASRHSGRINTAFYL